MTDIQETLAQRAKTHGDFADHSRISQGLKDVMRSAPNWPRLTAAQREALEMDAHKTARILCGDPDYADHAVDKVGYMSLYIRSKEPQP